MLLLPAELPDQLLLEGEKSDLQMESLETEDDIFEGSLSGRASADDAGRREMSEESIMKIELRGKIQDYMDSQTQEAVKLIRSLLAQDIEDKPKL